MLAREDLHNLGAFVFAILARATCQQEVFKQVRIHLAELLHQTEHPVCHAYIV